MTIEQFEILKEYGKRKSEIDGQKINVLILPYIFVKSEFLQMVQENKINEAVEQTLNHLNISFNKLSIKDYMSVFLYLYDELLTEKGIVASLERQFLSSEPDPKMISAGVSMLNPFNVHLTLLSLCKELNMSFHEAEKEPYHFLLDIQVALFRQQKVKNNYNEILLKK